MSHKDKQNLDKLFLLDKTNQFYMDIFLKHWKLLYRELVSELLQAVHWNHKHINLSIRGTVNWMNVFTKHEKQMNYN